MERLAFSFFLFGDGSRRRPDRLFSFFRPGGLRTKIEFIGFAGTRTQTLPGPGPPFPLFPARWFAYENRIHWLCGQSYANPAGARATFSLSSGSGFAHENRVHWLCGQPCANPPGPGLYFPLFPSQSSRSKTESIGFADRRARTSPGPGPPFLLFSG